MPALGALGALNITSMLPEDLKKAKIEVLDERGRKSREIEVLFNPSQYTLQDSAKYSTRPRPGSDVPQMTFIGGNATTLQVELFFDTSPVLTTTVLTSAKASDVSKKVKDFEELVYIKGNLHAPPSVKFKWGSLSFKGVVTDVKSTYTKFTESGMPIQARVELSLMSCYSSSEKKRKSPFESPDRTKCRMIREDCSIWDIALNEYGDVSKWKVIARANNLADPLHIPPGTIIKVPAL